jgi:biofilm PGA synthesis N-glycosyltransferase PgaC
VHIALVVPFLNEERNLPTVLDSISSQSRLPDRVLLVDDGSTDASSEIAAAFATEHGYADIARRPPRKVGRDRLAAGSAVRAFAWGAERLGDGWDVVAKIDADLKLTSTTLATLERALEDEPQLGIAGAYLSTPDEQGIPVRHRGRPEHVDGATKFYRRACYEAIAPMPLLLGWDSIDEVRAHLRGWKTGSVAIPEGDPLHLRPMSSHDGLLRGYRRRGECAWCAGEPLLHVVLIGIQRVGDRPRGLAGLNYVIGWLQAALRRTPRAEPEVLEAVRHELMTRIRLRARRELAGLVQAT